MALRVLEGNRPGCQTDSVQQATKRRLLALAAALWTGGYAAGYLNLVLEDDPTIPLLYLALLAAAIGLLLAAAVEPGRGWALVSAVVALVVAAGLALLSIGIFLAPALLLALLALVIRPDDPAR